MTEKYAMYLRKSRADMELEAMGEGETLARHKKMLEALAAKHDIHPDQITIYKEVVSGENIAERPQMQKLLQDVYAKQYKGVLANYELYATGTTGTLIMGETALPIHRMKSGPLGGDQQLGAMIASGEIDMLIFFWDPMSAQPHDVDVKALLRLATLYNVPTAINRSSADFLISSPLMAHDEYSPVLKDYTSYIERSLK